MHVIELILEKLKQTIAGECGRMRSELSNEGKLFMWTHINLVTTIDFQRGPIYLVFSGRAHRRLYLQNLRAWMITVI